MMTPNLFVAAKTAVQPHKWFQGHGPKAEADAVEHRDHPVPGIYKHFKGRGWYLFSPEDKDDDYVADGIIRESGKVVYSKCLHRWLFETEYKERSRMGYLPGPSSGRPSTPLASDPSERNNSTFEVGFFLMDDGLTWINNIDHEGYFIPGPYQPFVIDKQTQSKTVFREMTVGDSRHGTPVHSRNNSRMASRSKSQTPSRRNSPDSEDQRYKVRSNDPSEALNDLSVTPRGRQSDSRRTSTLMIPSPVA